MFQAGGGALEDPSDSQSGNDPSSEPHALRRVNTARARAVSKEVPQGKSEVCLAILGGLAAVLMDSA